jgi:hypothetical protein
VSARDDYPLLAARETVIRFGMEQTAVELTRALDEIDRLRTPPPEERHTFDRFKYAEEYAHTVDRHGVAWRMFRDPDETFEEDGETYTHPVYVVEWSGW